MVYKQDMHLQASSIKKVGRGTGRHHLSFQIVLLELRRAEEAGLQVQWSCWSSLNNFYDTPSLQIFLFLLLQITKDVKCKHEWQHLCVLTDLIPKRD